jgi:hypothetical protein
MVFVLAKKKYVDPHIALGYLVHHNPKLIWDMKVGDEYAVVMDNGVFVVSLVESDESASGTDYVIKELHSVQGEGLIRFANKKLVAK